MKISLVAPSLFLALALCASMSLHGFATDDANTNPADAAKLEKWPAGVTSVTYLSAADNTQQPTLFYNPKSDKPVPLLVALHTWSSDYLAPAEPAYAKWCIAKGWAFVHPNFRGPNGRPEACGSELVVKDILSVVDYAKKQAAIDPDRIYLVGVSGGGYASMLMAARKPEIWAGVSAWCGLGNLKDWYAFINAKPQSLAYVKMLEKVCGGAPGASPMVDEQYTMRSPDHYFAAAKNLPPLDINTGIQDGHHGSVPDSQSLNAFNVLALPKDRLSDADIATVTDSAQIPPALQFTGADPLYSRAPVLLRKISGNTRVTVFKAGHQIVMEAALGWLEQQRRGKPAVWDFTPAPGVDLRSAPTDAAK